MLLERVQAQTEAALQAGALQPIPTRAAAVPAGALSFVVRIVTGRAPKSSPGRAAPDAIAANESPFLRPQAELFVQDLSATHVCLLNKYPVVEHHLLIVTRAFEEQESLLDEADFAALAALLDQIDGLGFYNAGRAAGASQRHKHLQLVPSLGAGPERCPLDPVVLRAAPGKRPTRSAELPFEHALVRLPRVRASHGRSLAGSYHALRSAVGLEGERAPYNLLVTRDWMLLVPRSQEEYAGIEVNALGFAGALLLRREDLLERLCEIGPLALLRGVGKARAERRLTSEGKES